MHDEEKAGADLPGFSVGIVLKRSLRVYLSNLPAFAGLVAVLILPPYVFFIWVRYGLGILPGLEPSQMSPAVIVAGSLAPLVESFLSSIASGAIALTVLGCLDGRQFGFGRAFSNAVKLVPRALPASAAATLVFAAGLAALILPGLYVAVLLWVVVPVAVVEKLSVREACYRSASLSKGVRWPVFWLIALSLLTENLLARLVDLSADYDAAFVGWLAIKWALAAVLAAFWAVVTAVGYDHLRRLKHARGLPETAAVFD